MAFSPEFKESSMRDRVAFAICRADLGDDGDLCWDAFTEAAKTRYRAIADAVFLEMESPTVAMCYAKVREPYGRGDDSISEPGTREHSTPAEIWRAMIRAAQQED